MLKALDYSFARPPVAELRAAGIGLVVRYDGPVGPGQKGLSKDEAQALRAAGIAIGVVHEGSAGDAKLGTVKGSSDAVNSTERLDLVGCPRSAAVFFACDTFCTVGEVRPYFQGVRPHNPRPVGWYGGLGVGLQLHAEGLVDHVWAANATSWSGFSGPNAFAELETAAHAHGIAMLQHLDHPFGQLPSGSYDYDEIITPFPAWGYNPEATPVVPPKMHVTLSHPIVGYLEIPGVGAWLCTEDGGIFTLAGRFYGTPVGKPYWTVTPHRATNIVVNPVVANRKAHPYVVVDAVGHTFGIAGF